MINETCSQCCNASYTSNWFYTYQYYNTLPPTFDLTPIGWCAGIVITIVLVFIGFRILSMVPIND